MAIDVLTDLLRRQYGLVSPRQALDAGMNVASLRALLRSGRLEEVAPSVYSVPGHRPSWRRELWRAHLHAGPDSVVSHESAARLTGFDRIPPGLVVVTVAGRRRHPPAGVRWHRSVDLDPEDITTIDGLPVTVPARTVVDLASRFRIGRLRQVVEQGVLERWLTLPHVGAVLGRVRRRGKPGVARLAAVLDAMGPGDGIPHSELERLLDRVLEGAELARSVHEHPLPNARGRTGFVDRCFPEAKLIIEGDGRKWHARHQQMLADADRELEAQALGFDTSRLLWEHLAHDPEGTADLVRTIYELRVALLSDTA